MGSQLKLLGSGAGKRAQPFCSEEDMRLRSLQVILLVLLVALPSSALPPNLLKGGSFDQPNAMRNWQVAGIRGSADWIGVDSLARPSSGSAMVMSRIGGINQCVPVLPLQTYDF